MKFSSALLASFHSFCLVTILCSCQGEGSGEGSGRCSLDKDCDRGQICLDGVCLPEDSGGDCEAGQQEPCYTGPAGTEGQGLCLPGIATCGADGKFGACVGEITPAAEDCDDGLDNDCNGRVDDVCGGCGGGDVKRCYGGPDGTQGIGQCRWGEMECIGGEFWSECEGDVVPEPEVCDGVDNDCDGEIDEGLMTDGDGDGHYATGSCSEPADDCDDADAAVHPGAEEICDGIDNNCDGQVDEGFPVGEPCRGDGLGECAGDGLFCCDSDGGSVVCDADPGQPSPEECDGLDNDCDGETDEDLSRPCLDCDGQPTGQEQRCEEGAWIPPCPTDEEICDGVDNDCDGYVDEDLDCYGDPGATCWAHYWFDMVLNDGEGRHLDTCMNCTDRPGFDEGSKCTYSPAGEAGTDMELECYPAMQMIADRQSPVWEWTMDFMAADIPLHNPFRFRRCLVAWGVHKLVKIDYDHIQNKRALASTAYIPGGMADSQPLEMEGLRTLLPSAAFQHALVEIPALPSVYVPSSKAERAARILWEEPSVSDKRGEALHAPYRGCPECVTFEDLIDFVYPGPEIYCQGLPRDPADSQFVIPLWMPYYDALLGTQNHVIMTELVCEYHNGELVGSVTAYPLPFMLPEDLPVTYP